MSLQEIPYNPKYYFFGLTDFYLASPLIGLLAAAAVSVVIAYFFFKKGLDPKKIYLEIEEDRLVFEPATTALLYDQSKNPVHCASICTFRLRREGTGQVREEDVVEPLVVTLNQVKKIISFRNSESKGNWEALSLTEPDYNRLSVRFKRLLPGDYIKITALCEQEKPLDIEPRLDGDIKDVSILTRLYKIRGFPAKMAILYLFSMLLGVFSSYLIIRATNLMGFEGVNALIVSGLAFMAIIIVVAATRDFWLKALSEIASRLFFYTRKP